MKKIASTFLFIVLGILQPGTVLAGVHLNLFPSAPTVTPGDLLSVDVFISGLGNGVPPSVGAFDLDIAFDPGILTPIAVVFGPFLGDPSLFEALVSTDFSIPGIADIAETSLLHSAELDALQPSNFSLATLTFAAIGSGQSLLSFVGDVRVDDAFGIKLAIPEPGTALLLALGLLALLQFTRVNFTTGHVRQLYCKVG